MGTTKYLIPVSFAEKMQKEQEFFDKNFTMSYSGLSKLRYSPALFYHHYVLGQREDTVDKNMVEGSLIHCLLLTPERFNDDFVIMPSTLPSENPTKVINMLYEQYKVIKAVTPTDKRESLADFSTDLLKLLIEVNLYQTLKQDVQRLSKIINERTETYWEFLKKANGKTIIDDDVNNFCMAVVEKCKNSGKVMDLMGFFGNSFNGIAHYNELELAKFEPSLSFGLRGFIDNLVIDSEKKEIRINDLKKTGKSLSLFEESIEYYNYWMQAGMYYKLVEYNYKHLLDEGYSLVFRFIVIDPYMQIAPIHVSQDTLKSWLSKTDQALEEANYHFQQKNFDLPYDYLTTGEKII